MITQQKSKDVHFGRNTLFLGLALVASHNMYSCSRAQGVVLSLGVSVHCGLLAIISNFGQAQYYHVLMQCNIVVMQLRLLLFVKIGQSLCIYLTCVCMACSLMYQLPSLLCADRYIYICILLYIYIYVYCV